MKKIIILILMIILLTGCSSKKCIKSHTEKTKCIAYTSAIVGNTPVMIPRYYNCIKTICDEYEKVSE